MVMDSKQADKVKIGAPPHSLVVPHGTFFPSHSIAYLIDSFLVWIWEHIFPLFLPKLNLSLPPCLCLPKSIVNVPQLPLLFLPHRLHYLMHKKYSHNLIPIVTIDLRISKNPPHIVLEDWDLPPHLSLMVVCGGVTLTCPQLNQNPDWMVLLEKKYR